MTTRSRMMPGVLIAALALPSAACSDRVAPPLAPDASRVAAVKVWEAGSSLAWNQVARELTVLRSPSPIVQTRLFAYLSVAQYNAIVAAEDAKDAGEHASPAGAAAAASAAVLRSFFPGDVGVVDGRLVAQRAAETWPGAQHDDFAAGEAIGRAIGAAVLAYAATDGTNLTTPPPNPGAPGNWTGVNSIRGLYGTRTFALESGDQFRPAPPPAYLSPEFDAALEEVRQLTANLSPMQLAIAQAWATRGTGWLNGIASDMIVAHHRTEREAARILALANMAVFDATNACFDGKFAYWYIRPSQADNTLHLWIAMPNHPSYPSGHSCQTASVVTVLESVFPEEREQLEALIVEAGLSRMYGGLHYRFDCEAGQQVGRDVAAWVLQAGVKRNEAIALD